MKNQLFNEPEEYSRSYQPGFKFRGLNDPTIFMNNNHKRLAQNYRNSFLRLAINYLDKGKKSDAVATLDRMEEKLPRNLIQMRYELLNDLGSLYYSAGGIKQYLNITSEIEPMMLKMLDDNPRDFQRQRNPYVVLRDIYENNGDYNKLVELFSRLQKELPDDQNVKDLVQKYQAMADAKSSKSIPKDSSNNKK